MALRLGQCRARQLHILLGVPDLFGRDRMTGKQGHPLREVRLRAAQLELARLDHRIVLTGNGFLLAHLPHRARKRTRTAAQIRFGIDGIELYEHLTRMHQLRVVSEYRNHRSGDLRRDDHPIAVHIGIIGALAVGEYQHPVGSPDAAQHDEHECDEQQHPRSFARRLNRGCRFDDCVHGVVSL